MANDPHDLLGRALGGYQLDRILGGGGMGIGLVIWSRSNGSSSMAHSLTATTPPMATTPPTSTPLPGGTPYPNLVPPSLYTLGFTGWERNGVYFILPPVVTVPTGAFTMGSDPSKDPQTGPDEFLHQVTLAAYEIGGYHLTVAEYALAVQAQAVPVPPSWNFPADATYVAQQWRGKTFDWNAQQSRPDHPVVQVSWLNILAYTQWLA